MLILLVVAIVATMLFLRFFTFTKRTERSLLAPVPGLVVLEDLSAVQALVPIPTQTFGADLYLSALYTQTSDLIPKGTVSLVYTKGNARFIEIDYIPNISIKEYLATHLYPTEEIHLTQTKLAWMLTIDSHPRCIDYEDNIPNRCEISHYLLTESDDRLILIAADGDHPTTGEMIEIAKDLTGNVDPQATQ